jgi:uncharacterized protein (DUF1778 family)
MAYNVRTLERRGKFMAAGRLQERAKTRRLNIRATKRQEELIRIGAETRGVSLTDFILESACMQAEHLLADQREFVASRKQWEEFTKALERPARKNPELARLFSETAAIERGAE